MGRQDLGTCIIMSGQDAGKLNLNLRSLQKIGNFYTPFKSPNRKRLRKMIEEKAKKEEADIAVITHQSNCFTYLREYVSYSYSLYKYK